MSDGSSRFSLPALPSWLITALKVVVSLGLISLLLTQVDLGQMADAVSLNLIPALIAASLVLMLQSVGMGYRWHALLSELGLLKNLRWAMRHAFIATFFNQCLPSSIGGDGYRVLISKRAGFGWQAAMSSVMVERYTALICLFVVAAIGLIPLGFALTESSLIWLFVIFVVSGFAGTFVVASLAEIAAFQKLPGLVARVLNAWIVGRVFADMRRVIRSRRLLMILGGAGLFNNAMNGVAVWIVGQALGVELGVLPYMTVMAIATLITVIPISMAGWGLRDGVVVFILVATGVGEAEALIISISYGIGLLLSSIPGGVLLWRSVGYDRKALVEQASQADPLKQAVTDQGGLAQNSPEQDASEQALHVTDTIKPPPSS
ncbi:MAG: lysylphosphatidylglycerol synthase transmembrane domain-containing protein [Pseudomonadota bacterium]